MIDITALLSQSKSENDSIRYASGCKKAWHGVAHNRGPVVAWNITKRCNFTCKHCYSNADENAGQEELSLHEIKSTIDEMAALKVPVILLSGGEPMMHDHIFEIIEYIKASGIRVSLSTNGSLITKDVASRLKKLGVGYVGISLDGIGEINDSFRGVKGAFSSAVEGIRNCNHVGQKVGLRMTVHKENVSQVPAILSFMEDEGVNRVCFYHLVPSGRGANIKDQMMSHQEARDFLKFLVNYTSHQDTSPQNMVESPKEILTVTNHVDGPYTYLLIKDQDPELAQSLLHKLKNNKGNRSGIAIMNMDWSGNVYPDQFSKFMPLGNIREKSLEDIWIKGTEALNQLRHKKEYLNQRCSSCKWLDICGGNLRARAYMTTGDLWGHDPACYLKDDEI